MVHGDIRPSAIFLKKASQSVTTMLYERISTNTSHKVQQENIMNKRQIYMSPIMYYNLSWKNQNFQHNPFKSDAFS